MLFLEIMIRFTRKSGKNEKGHTAWKGHTFTDLHEAGQSR
jgi:hypothetical protein